MWRLNKTRHNAGGKISSLEDFRLKRRENERTLRQARRDKQLVSKRLILIEDEDQPDVTMDTAPAEQDVVSLLHRLKRDATGKEAHLRALGKVLHDPTAHLTFVKQENSIHLLVGLLSGPDARCRLQAVRCLHELSHSPNTSVALACLPATPYLLTYLSGQSTRFTELCLYTLGNMCPDSEAVKDKLLAQGIIPALVSCVENQKHNLAVVEAAFFTLGQLLQTKDAAEKVAPMVLASSLPLHLFSSLTPDPDFGLTLALECAWCLHYLICSTEDHSELLARGALLKSSSLLVSIGGSVALGNKDQGIELLVCPLLRCVGNLLSSCSVEDLSTHVENVHLVDALCGLVHTFLHTQPALTREAAWVLNNLTALSPDFCSALLNPTLVPGLIQLLSFSQGINTMIIRILANVAHKKREFCMELVQLGLLPALSATLRMADREVVTLSLDILFMAVGSSPQVAEDFVKHGGFSLLEAFQYNSEAAIRRRATYLLERHLRTYQ